MCLCAYPVDDWQKLISKVNQMPQTSDAVKYFMRRVIGSAVECEVDRQGRVLVAPALRTDAGLKNEVVMLGLGNRIEIWDKDQLDGVADPKNIDKQAYKEEFTGLGL